MPELLETATVLVVSDALGFTGGLNRLGLRTHGRAFDTDDVEAVSEWVRAGGSSLLVADRPPAVEAARPLASALGVSIADGAFHELGRGRVAVVKSQLADLHNHGIDSRATMLAIVHWLSRAE